jgi:hypothetical protein
MKSFAALLVVLSCVIAPFAHAQRSTTIILNPAPHGILKVRASILGREGTFLFDSGGGVSSLSPQFAAAIGCHPWGQITGFRMTGDRLDMQRCDHVSFALAGRSFPAGTVGVFDISKYLPPETGPVDGTIALDLFADQAFTLSYAGHFLRILDQPGLLQESKALHSMQVHIVRDAEGLALTVNLPVVTPAGTAWFEMDSGNTSNLVLVNKALAPLCQMKSEGKETSSGTFQLEDGTTFTGDARVLDLILDGNLGASFLSRHDVTLDLAHHTAWIHASTAPGAGSGQ